MDIFITLGTGIGEPDHLGDFIGYGRIADVEGIFIYIPDSDSYGEGEKVRAISELVFIYRGNILAKYNRLKVGITWKYSIIQGVGA